MKTRSDILPLIGAVTLAVTVLQGATQGSISHQSPAAQIGNSVDVAGVGVDISKAQLAGVGVDISKAQLAAVLIARLEGKGVDIS